MKSLLLAAAFVLCHLFAGGQGVLQSHFMGGAPDEVCVIAIRNLDNHDSVIYHTFRSTSRITMKGGDYRITYWADTTYLHGEFMHFSANEHGVIQVYVFRHPPLLKGFNFKKLKFIKPEDIEGIYMEF